MEYNKSITISHISEEEKLQIKEYVRQLKYKRNPTCYCDIRGCPQKVRASCCGCPEYFEWKRNKKEK